MFSHKTKDSYPRFIDFLLIKVNYKFAAVVFLIAFGISYSSIIFKILLFEDFRLHFAMGNLVLPSIMFLLFFSISLFSAFGIRWMLWNQYFLVEGNSITDNFPIRRVFRVIDIYKIVIVEKDVAHILIKPADIALNHAIYWHGNIDSSFSALLDVFSSSDPGIKSRVYANPETFDKLPSSIKIFAKYTVDSSRTSYEKKTSQNKVLKKTIPILQIAIIINVLFWFQKYYNGSLNPLALFFIVISGSVVLVSTMVLLRKNK